MFSFDWSELRSILEDLAETPTQRDRVQAYVGGIAKQASTIGRSETLKMILTAAYLIQHEDPQRVIDDAQSLFQLH